jgi:hypothetical protein
MIGKFRGKSQVRLLCFIDSIAYGSICVDFCQDLVQSGKDPVGWVVYA